MKDDVFLKSCGIAIDEKWVSESIAQQAAFMLLNPAHTDRTKTHVRSLLKISEMLSGVMSGGEA